MSERVVVALTPHQLRALIELVDAAPMRGRDAALVVSIQPALAQAWPSTPPPSEEST